MSRKTNYKMAKTGEHGDFERFVLLPCSVANAVSGPRTTVISEYGSDTDSLLDDDDDSIQTSSVEVGNKKFDIVNYGSDNTLPYELQRLVLHNSVTSRCQAFNIQTCYGQGLQFFDRNTNDKADDPDIRRFCLRNNIHRLFVEQCTDIKFFYFSVMVLVLNKDRTQIVQIRHRDACHCRFTKRNNDGKIENVVYANFRSYNPTGVEIIPLLDEIDPLGDLLVRMGQEPDPKTGTVRPADKVAYEPFKFAIAMRIPTPGNGYYPIPYYTAIFNDYWYDIYRLIGIGKRYLIKNTSAPRIQIEVHKSYWDNVCDEEGILEPQARINRKIKERDNITDFCTKPENAGKAWVTNYDTTIEGREVRMVRIYNLNDSAKKEGGDWSDDMQEAANSICFAMGVHPNVVGAVPGKSQMNNSGSDKRELFTLKQSLEKLAHDIAAVPYHVVMHYNGWAEKYYIDVPMIELTTLDKNTSSQVSTLKPNKKDDDNSYEK